eukprot:2302027-Amphidinium_carterae.1
MSTSLPAKRKAQEASVDRRTKAKGDKAQMASDGEHFTHNRAGNEICRKFNEGGCSLPCPGKRVHQCSKCLQTGHTAVACPGRKGKGCGKGQAASDPTTVEALLCKVCKHPKRNLMYTDNCGVLQNIYAGHVPLRGRRTPDGKWATAASAMYPSELNRALAKAIASTAAQSDSPKVLSLFGGRQGREDGLHVYLKEQRIGRVTVDIVNEPWDENDLLNDLLWQQLLDRVKSREFSFLMAAPGCTIWSRARQLHDGGPRPLRSQDELYGLQPSSAVHYCRKGAVESWHALRP